MSATTVRAQMQAFLTAGNVTGLEKVFLSQPWFIDGGAWSLASNNGWGAIAWPWITDDSEERLSLGAPDPSRSQQAAGQKKVTYKLSIMIVYKYLIPATVTSEDAWQPPLDEIIDGVKARLRSDPNCGMPSVIWQAGQDDGDLSITRDLPRQLAGKVVSWSVVEFTVYEVVTA